MKRYYILLLLVGIVLFLALGGASEKGLSVTSEPELRCSVDMEKGISVLEIYLPYGGELNSELCYVENVPRNSRVLCSKTGITSSVYVEITSGNNVIYKGDVVCT